MKRGRVVRDRGLFAISRARRELVVCDLAFVQPGRKLVQVALKVLRAGMVVNTDQPAFKDSPNALDAVRGYLTARILSGEVLNVNGGAVLVG